MQSILTKLPNDKAQKELRTFTLSGLALSLVSLLVLWPLGIAGLAFSARGLLLTKHKANQDNPKLTQYRIMAIVGVLAGLVSIIYGTTR